MLCDQCRQQDNVTFVHPTTGRRYCQKCWSIWRPQRPIPIDQCSDAVKNAAAMAGVNGTVWKPRPSLHRWPDRATTELERSIAEAQGQVDAVLAAAAANKEKEEVAKNKPILNKCNECQCITNDGQWLDSTLYLCSLCLTDIEEAGGGMTTKHLKMKLRGSDTAIAFFHYVCGTIDNDWPWRRAQSPSECPKCGGVLYVNSILTAEEIRGIADQAGVRKCKIPYFGDVKTCFGG